MWLLWFIALCLGGSALSRFDQGKTGTAWFLAVLCVVFVVAGLVDYFLDDDD